VYASRSQLMYYKMLTHYQTSDFSLAFTDMWTFQNHFLLRRTTTPDLALVRWQSEKPYAEDIAALTMVYMAILSLLHQADLSTYAPPAPPSFRYGPKRKVIKIPGDKLYAYIDPHKCHNPNSLAPKQYTTRPYWSPDTPKSLEHVVEFFCRMWEHRANRKEAEGCCIE
jgi:hypothetical protein